MAQKAAKTLASRNTQRLNKTHLITLSLHIIFLFLRSLTFHKSFTYRSIILYIICAGPALALEFWLESVGRPKYYEDGQGKYGGGSYGGTYGGEAGKRELKSSGEDLDAKGLTEWMWDVVYWTWGCIAFAGVLGDWAWSLWLVVPLYTIYAAYTTYTGARSGLGMGAGGLESDGTATGSGTSKRQAKLEKRGGQRVAYR